ncbi:MAG TPA: hypothetical protein VE954_12550 [Oligoflexus sp.]|uniref:hypothetical protein n=1 Tax=Oligoflexus sp. TaxID=1971216 RepID=UPI002D22D4FF|nr:hypothetical protein [Oligoflexus sp.]HYX33938.1 hypothetical protein [Oligoflexus sp.]
MMWIIRSFLVATASCSILASCGGGRNLDYTVMTQVMFENQSQFTVEALYLHENPLDYTGRDNLLANPLEPDGSISDSIPAVPWYVTVFRKPNQDSSVLAYTTAKVWDPLLYPKIIYFDEQYRVSTELGSTASR